jgi:hypothetical protein
MLVTVKTSPLLILVNISPFFIMADLLGNGVVLGNLDTLAGRVQQERTLRG